MFSFGQRSLREQEGVHPTLILIADKAITYSEVDFGILDGLRTAEEQHNYFLEGASKLDGYFRLSKHQAQPEDNYGHAMDLVPYINGKYRWELAACCEVALAVRKAALEVGAGIRWGGSWERLDTDPRHPDTMVQDYIKKRLVQGRKPFVDGPHYELLL